MPNGIINKSVDPRGLDPIRGKDDEVPFERLRVQPSVDIAVDSSGVHGRNPGPSASVVRTG